MYGHGERREEERVRCMVRVTWKLTLLLLLSLQLCPTLGEPIPGILQAITLEWVAISFSRKLTLPYVK